MKDIAGVAVVVSRRLRSWAREISWAVVVRPLGMVPADDESRLLHCGIEVLVPIASHATRLHASFAVHERHGMIAPSRPSDSVATLTLLAVPIFCGKIPGAVLDLFGVQCEYSRPESAAAATAVKS